MTTIGRCKDCTHMIDGYCFNTKKICEEAPRNPSDTDCLCYEFYEGGRFLVGDDFGCIHFKPRTLCCDVQADGMVTNQTKPKP